MFAIGTVMLQPPIRKWWSGKEREVSTKKLQAANYTKLAHYLDSHFFCTGLWSRVKGFI